MTTRAFEDELRRRLEEVDASGLRRWLRQVGGLQGTRVQVDGSWLVNFSSNDYLGLSMHPAVREAAAVAAARWGGGSGASRLVCGSLAVHHELEQELADFKRCEAAVAFGSGHAAALGTVPALVGPGDVVALDKKAHACLVDAARLSRATLRVFRHNDVDDLARILAWADGQGAAAGQRPRVLVITESVFSMDGERAPLVELVELKDKHGAWLMVDEAHATGVHGEDGRGLVDELGLAGRVEVQMGTLGKALGAAGGCICGSRALADWLVNRARSFVFSTAPVPAAAAAALAGLRLARGAVGRRRRQVLWWRVEGVRRVLERHGEAGAGSGSAIQPMVLGAESRALEVSRALRAQGVLVPAIRYPTVARGSARLRVTATALHTESDVDLLGRALDSAMLEAGRGERDDER